MGAACRCDDKAIPKIDLDENLGEKDDDVFEEY